MAATTSPIGRIVGINLTVMLAYAVGLRVFAELSGSEEQMTFVIFMALLTAAHAVVALVLALVLGLQGQRDRALGYLASAPLVLLIGTGVCFGGAAIDLGGRGRSSSSPAN